jgi:HK97 gp10 family phage protein
MPIEWNTADVTSFLDKRCDSACRAMCFLLVRKLREKLSQPYPPASEAGEPPHKRTGDLISEVGFVKDGKNQYRVIVTGEVAAYLEFGTSLMEPRPFMLPTIEENRKDLANAGVTAAATGKVEES